MALLGEMLLSEKILTPKELDIALENHVLHRVKLGTCLVEMGFVTDDDLARCLGKQAGRPFLSKDHLLEFGARHLSVVSPAMIKKDRVIPVGTQGGAFRIATDVALSPQKHADLEKFLGYKIELVTVSSYAVDFFLEQMFGKQRPGRFLPKYSRISTQEEAPAPAEQLNQETAHIVIDGVEWKSLADVTQDGGTQDGKPGRTVDDVINPALNNLDAPLTLSAAAEQLSQARSRDDVARIILGHVSNTSEIAALLIVKDGVARGWKACSNRKNIPKFEEFSAPLEKLPDLGECVATKRPCFGSTMTAMTKLLLKKPHHSGGRSAFFPIFIQKRVIAVLLCDGSDINPDEIAKLCRNASYALEILVLRSKILSI